MTVDIVGEHPPGLLAAFLRRFEGPGAVTISLEWRTGRLVVARAESVTGTELEHVPDGGRYEHARHHAQDVTAEAQMVVDDFLRERA